METIRHLWNVNQLMTKFKCPLTTELQTFYIQTCKNLKDEVELPKQIFGPSVMCSYCGSLWSTMNYQARISRGRKMSKSMKKIVQCMNEQKVTKARATLAEKSIKNEMNKLIIKCSVCSKMTELPFRKSNRLKPVKLGNLQTETPQSNNHKKKKKKKKNKDKTAGLNISADISMTLKKNDSKTPMKSITPKINSNTSKINSNTSKINSNTPKINNNTPKISSNKKIASANKPKKFNIKRLQHIMSNSTITPIKKRSLHNFLAEL